MLSSGAGGNQYLRPEYLTPLPTTLDAKKSPLALLAQTCSQIGADSPNSKLLSSSEKSKSSKNSDSHRDKSSPASTNDSQLKSSFKPYESNIIREKTGSPEDRSSTSSTGSRVRTPTSGGKPNSSTPHNSGSRCGSNQSAVSPRASPSERKTPANDAKSTESSTPTKNSESNSTPTTSSISTSKTSPTPSVLTSATDLAVKDLPLGTFKPGSIPVSTAAYLGSPYATPGLPHPMDLMASSLMSHHALKSGALSPYLSYARMKNPAGGDSLVPVCRDPYCTGCSLSSHLLGASNANGKTPSSATCPAGCAQCDHAAKPTGYLGHSPAAAAYAHAQLAALAAASQLPYVCNWIAGDAQYCGKRFGTSEELLQHLRTHTSLASVSESMLNPASLQAAHPLLHRTYPTPPLSPLATARYHPYSKPSLLPPSLTASSLAAATAASFPLGHPGLSPYFSPYSLYGPRLGAASSMHP